MLIGASLSEPHTSGETGCIFYIYLSYVRCPVCLRFACSNLTIYNISLPRVDCIHLHKRTWIQAREGLLNLQRSEEIGFSVEKKERELVGLQRHQNKGRKIELNLQRSEPMIGFSVEKRKRESS